VICELAQRAQSAQRCVAGAPDGGSIRYPSAPASIGWKAIVTKHGTDSVHHCVVELWSTNNTVDSFKNSRRLVD